MLGSMAVTKFLYDFYLTVFAQAQRALFTSVFCCERQKTAESRQAKRHTSRRYCRDIVVKFVQVCHTERDSGGAIARIFLTSLESSKYALLLF